MKFILAGFVGYLAIELVYNLLEVKISLDPWSRLVARAALRLLLTVLSSVSVATIPTDAVPASFWTCVLLAIFGLIGVVGKLFFGAGTSGWES
jgi:hypothetical protein